MLVKKQGIKKRQNIIKKQIIVNENKQFFLDNKASITYYENFISDQSHDQLFEELSHNVPWTVGIYNMFGHQVKTPRLLYAMKDPGTNITKSYNITDSIPWSVNVLKLKHQIEKITNTTFTYAQLNHYRSGEDYIGYHTDSEVHPGDIIVSVSLGAERQFCFRNLDKTLIYEMMLNKGSLLIMNEHSCKKNWKHQLPKMPSVDQPRINITFRSK